MPTVFPNNIDSFTKKVDFQDKVYADHVNLLQDAVTILQKRVGTKPSGGNFETSIEQRLKALIDSTGSIIDPYVSVLTYNSAVPLAVGQVLVIDENFEKAVKLSSFKGATKVAGISLDNAPTGPIEIRVARHPLSIIQVKTENEPILVGDYIITSEIEGIATKGLVTSKGIFAIALENFPANSTGNLAVLLNIGGIGGDAAGDGEWKTEAEVASAFNEDSNTMFKVVDEDNIKSSTYAAGRFLRMSVLDGGISTTFYAQVENILYYTPILELSIKNPMTSSGEAYQIPLGAPIVSLDYFAVQGKYIGTVGDVNIENTTLFDHISDGSIHTTNAVIFKTEDLSAQVAAVPGFLENRELIHGAASDGTICVFRNGLLLSPAASDASGELINFGEYMIVSPTKIKILVPIHEDENISISYVALRQYHKIRFNEKLPVLIGQSVFFTESPFSEGSLQVFRNGQLLLIGTHENQYQILDSNSFKLNTAVIDEEEKILCHYDDTRNFFPKSYSIISTGIAAVGENKGKTVTSSAGTITKISVVSDMAPDEDLRIDIKKRGPLDNTYVSIFEEDEDKPIIFAGEYYTQVSTEHLTPLVIEGTRLRLDIETCGSISSPGGNDLVVNIVVIE